MQSLEEPIEEFEIAIEPSHAAIGPARGAVGELLAARGVTGDESHDVLLVLSELLTNAVQQQPGEPITLCVQIGRQHAVVEVANRRRGAPIPPRDQWAPAHALAPHGRGLAILDAICDRVEVADDDATTTVTATCSLGAGPSC